MKPIKYRIQSAGGLATALIRQKLADEIVQYKPQDEQLRSSTLPSMQTGRPRVLHGHDCPRKIA